MDILVKKPSASEITAMRTEPVWECEPSEFDWYYDNKETCLIVDGEFEIKHDGGSVAVTAGDYVVFPKGLSCVWRVTKPVKKHYKFG